MILCELDNPTNIICSRARSSWKIYTILLCAFYFPPMCTDFWEPGFLLLFEPVNLINDMLSWVINSFSLYIPFPKAGQKHMDSFIHCLSLVHSSSLFLPLSGTVGHLLAGVSDYGVFVRRSTVSRRQSGGKSLGSALVAAIDLKTNRYIIPLRIHYYHGYPSFSLGSYKLLRWIEIYEIQYKYIQIQYELASRGYLELRMWIQGSQPEGNHTAPYSKIALCDLLLTIEIHTCDSSPCFEFERPIGESTIITAQLTTSSQKGKLRFPSGSQLAK